MARQPFVVGAGAMLLMVVALMAGSVSAQGKWWTSERFIKLLGLSQEQSAQLEEVFQSAIREQGNAKQELDRQEARFSELLTRDDAAENEVMVAIEQLESARGELGKLRALMLYRMRRVLTPQQRATLEADWQKAVRNGPRQGPGSRPQPGGGGPPSR